ncbi:hypothetical protein BDF21DRAFT_419155 [Thamnidium elegans]|nr:hypothetical protein BDF21DRAFT_419155 [Thamnidium elegans]
MNIKTQVAILTLLHIIPLELRYGHYLLDLGLSKLADPKYITSFLKMPYINFTYVLYLEALVILLSLVAPKSNYISKVLFSTNQPDLISFTPEKTKPKPATHWLSSILDILILINISYSSIFASSMFFSAIILNLIQYYNDLTIPFFSTLMYHALLLSYAGLLYIVYNKFSDQRFHLAQFYIFLYVANLPFLIWAKDTILSTAFNSFYDLIIYYTSSK